MIAPWLRSGIFKMEDKKIYQIPDFIAGRLFQSVMSDSSLEIDDELVVNILVTKSTFANGSVSGELISDGACDLDAANINLSANCILKHILLAKLFYSLPERNISTAISLFKERYDARQNIFDADIKELGIFDECFFRRNLFRYISHISRQMKRKIVLVCKGTKQYTVCFRTRVNNVDKHPICLLIDSEHATFVFDLNGIKSRGIRRKYCNICIKPFINLKFHHCLLHKRCYQCLRLQARYEGEIDDIRQSVLCARQVQMDATMICQKCHITFTNADCYFLHLSQTCKMFGYCDQCQSYFKISKRFNHTCDQKYCLLCYQTHSKLPQSCCIKPAKFKTKSCDDLLSFLEVHYINGDPFAACLKYSKGYMEQLYQEGRFGFSAVIKPLLDALMSQNVHQRLLTDTITFALIQTHYKETKNTVHLGSLHVQDISGFLNDSVITLADLVGLPVYSILKPLQVYDVKLLSKNKSHDFTMGNFNLPQLIGFNEHIYSVLKQFLPDRMTYFSSLTLQEVLKFILQRRSDVMLASCQQLESFGYQLLTRINSLRTSIDGMMTNIDDLGSIFLYRSFSNFCSIIFKSSLEANIPIQTSSSQRSLCNTSKWEIIVAQLMRDLHRSSCKSTVRSFISGDGSQFKTEHNLSADIYCSVCSTSIFVEGMWKVACRKHPRPLNQTFYGSDILTNKRCSRYKRQRFKQYSNVDKVVVLNQCCLNPLKSNLTDLIREISRHTNQPKQYLEKYMHYIKSFERTNFVPLNLQDNIIAPTFINLVDYCITQGESFIMKLDMKSAYISILQSKDLILPTSQGLTLVHDDAHEWIQDNISSDLLFVAKISILPPTNNSLVNIIPYVPINIEDKSILTICYSCALQNQETTCLHADSERCFVTTLNSTDLRFALSLGYRILHTYEVCFYNSAKHCTTLGHLADILKDLRNDNDTFVASFSKRVALVGLGSLSMNYDKLTTKKCLKPLELQAGLFNGDVSQICFKGDTCLGETQKKNDITRSKYAETARLGTNPLIFGLVASAVRVLCYKLMSLLRQHNFMLLRYDVDCVMTLIESETHLNKLTQIINTFSDYQFTYEKLCKLINYSKRSYIYTRYEDNVSVMKCCGLRFFDKMDRMEGHINASEIKCSNIGRYSGQTLVTNTFTILPNYPFGCIRETSQDNAL